MGQLVTMSKKIKAKLKLILFKPSYGTYNKQLWQAPKRVRAYETVDVPGLCVYILDKCWHIGHIKSGTAITKMEWDNIKGPLEMVTEWLNEINWDKDETQLRWDGNVRQTVMIAEEHIKLLIINNNNI